MNITRGEHDLLNPAGINVIRAFPGRGIRVWGARTLSSDTTWRYINVRRLFNYIEASILGGTQWVVFEPNDLDLWQRIRRTINAFLLRLWRDGALFGATPDEAFYVKCDDETNPPDFVDAGQVTCEIGIAPVKPAEFVVFRLAQFSGGAASPNECSIRQTQPPDTPRDEERMQTCPSVRTPSPATPSRSRSTAGHRPVQGGLGPLAEVQVIEHRENNLAARTSIKKLPGPEEVGRHHAQARQDRRQGLLGLAQVGQGGQDRRGPQERLDRALRLRARRDDPVQLHQRLAVEGSIGSLQAGGNEVLWKRSRSSTKASSWRERERGDDRHVGLAGGRGLGERPPDRVPVRAAPRLRRRRRHGCTATA